MLKRAVCMHETDAGTLWKHTEYRTGHAEVWQMSSRVKNVCLASLHYWNTS